MTRFRSVPFLLISLAFLSPLVSGFTSCNQRFNGSRQSVSSQTRFTRCRVLMRNDLFDNFKKLWGGWADEDDQDGQRSGTVENEDDAAGTSLIASIPVRAIKPGGLRLFLMFYCMGMQNTPDRNSWRANQPSGDEYIVEMLYHDATGMLTIELLEEEIRITRCGSVPSTAYLMQEAIIVEGMLDELNQCAFDGSVPEGDRLLIPEPKDAIEMARGDLSFG